ncbi:MAG: hypothetical protein KJ063_04910 [Anaerolineae bacterium]|nr:hypothetical protein [Anaerolineae bacterium]
MLLIIEIIMLIGGIYALASAKVPSFLLGNHYQVEGGMARVIGALFIAPLPVSIFIGAALAILLGEHILDYAGIIELLTLLGVILLIIALMRTRGLPIEPVNATEAQVAKKAQGSLMYAILGVISGPLFLIFGPLAFIYAAQALKLMEKHDVGKQHRGKAQAAQIIVVVAGLLLLLIVACVVTSSLSRY